MLLNEKKTIEKAYAFLSKDPVMKFFIHSFGDEIDALDMNIHLQRSKH